jgi:hypothetical protein
MCINLVSFSNGLFIDLFPLGLIKSKIEMLVEPLHCNG